MAADTYSARLGLLEMGTGNQNNSWGDSFNASFANVIDRAIAGIIARADTGGTLDLSGSPPPAGARQDIEAIQNFTGALVSNLTVIVPNLSKTWLIANNTSGAFQLFIKTTAGTATQIPQGTTKQVYCDGGNGVFRADREHIGNFIHHGSNNIPSGSLLCNGSSLLRSDYPDLFSVIGATWGAADGTHFTLPLLTDTNRYLRAAKPGTLNVGNYQSNQNLSHSHAITGALSAGSLVTDNPGNHTHANSLTDNNHTHQYNAPSFPGGNVLAAGNGFQATQASTASSGPSVAPMSITNAAAGAHTHTITGAPGFGTMGIGTSGGTEARPESAVVLICIKY